MNDRPSHAQAALSHRPDPIGPACRYSGVPQTHQQLTLLNRPKTEMSRTEQSPPPVKPVGPMLATKDLAFRDRSVSSSGSSSPVKSAHGDVKWCLCQPAPKVPRPRNGESMMSAQSSSEHGKCILFCRCCSSYASGDEANETCIAFILYRQHYQAAVVHQNPGMANPEISKIIGAQWKALTDEERGKWKALANVRHRRLTLKEASLTTIQEEKARHSQRYPDYRYQPKRSGRDGGSRSSGLGHNPSGQSTCNRCGGRIMNAPSSPMTPFTPVGTPSQRSVNLSAAPSHPTMATARSSSREEPKPVPKPVGIDQFEQRTRRHFEENGDRSPEVKRRRVSQSLKPGMLPFRDRSPESPYPMSPYSAHPDMQPRNMLPMMHPQRQYGSAPGMQHPDGSLKLAPLKATTPVSTPLTPFSQDSSVEATVMTIPFLNKIKVLAKISPPLVPSFREGNPTPRGPVIAVDGQDPHLVQVTVEYLERLLKKEYTYRVRVFDGPEIHTDTGSADGQMGDATVRYLDTISAWHRISDEIVSYVKSASTANSVDARSDADDDSGAGLSPKTIMAKTASLQINSPAQSSENGSEASVMTSSTTGGHNATPVAIVPRYQLTTADAFACTIPINDSYAPLDHWQWMASLWRACVGPDITVYVRECSKEELDRAGGSPVEVRLQDARTVIIRRVIGAPRELEEKTLKRVGFEIEDFLTS